MAMKDGDVIRFDYTLWVKGSDKPTATSIEATAKENGLHRDERRYQPLTVTLGASQVIPGLESHIRSHGQVGQAVTVELAPADAYGERDPKKVQTIPMAKFNAQKVKPEVGMSLNLGNERGIVTMVAGGRVRVDTNHDMAGKTLKYEYTVREVLSDEKSKVNAVLDNLFPKDSYKVHIENDAVVVEVPDQAKFDQNWMMAKFRVVGDLRNATEKTKAIKLVEVYPVMKDEPKVESTDEPGHEGHGHGPGEHKH